MYYFAYGSNMNHEQMKKRCPSARFLTRVKLIDYEFVYDGYSDTRKGAVGNVIKSEGYIVEGGLFEVDELCISQLDRYEGYPRAYDRQILEVKDDNNIIYQAYVYLRQAREIGKPSEEYRNIVLQGAKDCGLTEQYIIDFL